ncbi:MAG: SLC13 family permease [Galactobacter sp.]
MLPFLAQVLPVLVFLLAIALVSEVCDRSGLFDVVGRGLLVAAGGRAWLLWVGLAVGCLAITAVLSLDTTAVLMAPVAISMAKRAGRDPLPFAVTCVWLANTGSLLLPVSNLTNLLSTGSNSPLTGSFASHTWPVALTASVVTLVVIVAFWPGLLRGRYEVPAPTSTPDRTLVWISAVVCVVLAALFGAGVSPTVPTVIAALLLAAVFWVRRPEQRRSLSVPWKMVLAVLALFILVELLRPCSLTSGWPPPSVPGWEAGIWRAWPGSALRRPTAWTISRRSWHCNRQPQIMPPAPLPSWSASMPGPS